ncbi:hypothetical protein [Arthrobacter sp. SO3]|nr:hypothetical protein [Arthrobacter sp. SO3]
MNLSEAKNVEGDGGPGTVVKHSYLMAGVPFPVTACWWNGSRRGQGSKL